MQNTIVRMTRTIVLVVVFVCLGVMPALAQNCARWSNDGIEFVEHVWERITPEHVQTCLDAIGNINIRDDDGQTPLHFAVINKNVEVTRILLDAGADASAPDGGNKTPLHKAAEYNSPVGVIKVLLDAGAKADAVSFEVGLAYDIFRTPIHQAAQYNGDAEVINMLVQAGADVNFNKNPALLGETVGTAPLHLALRYNNLEVVSALINAGADINLREGMSRRTPLHLAARWNKNPDVVMLLLKAGANGKARDANGVTPFALAKKNKAVKKSPAYQALKDAQ